MVQRKKVHFSHDKEAFSGNTCCFLAPNTDLLLARVVFAKKIFGFLRNDCLRSSRANVFREKFLVFPSLPCGFSVAQPIDLLSFDTGLWKRWSQAGGLYCELLLRFLGVEESSVVEAILSAMRPLTDDETKVLFEKLANYMGKNIEHLINRPDEKCCFRLHKDRVYYVRYDMYRAFNPMSPFLPRAPISFCRHPAPGGLIKALPTSNLLGSTVFSYFLW